MVEASANSSESSFNPSRHPESECVCHGRPRGAARTLCASCFFVLCAPLAMALSLQNQLIDHEYRQQRLNVIFTFFIDRKKVVQWKCYFWTSVFSDWQTIKLSVMSKLTVRDWSWIFLANGFLAMFLKFLNNRVSLWSAAWESIGIEIRPVSEGRVVDGKIEGTIALVAIGGLTGRVPAKTDITFSLFLGSEHQRATEATIQVTKDDIASSEGREVNFATLGFPEVAEEHQGKEHRMVIGVRELKYAIDTVKLGKLAHSSICILSSFQDIVFFFHFHAQWGVSQPHTRLAVWRPW